MSRAAYKQTTRPTKSWFKQRDNARRCFERYSPVRKVNVHFVLWHLVLLRKIQGVVGLRRCDRSSQPRACLVLSILHRFSRFILGSFLSWFIHITSSLDQRGATCCRCHSRCLSCGRRRSSCVTSLRSGTTNQPHPPWQGHACTHDIPSSHIRNHHQCLWHRLRAFLSRILIGFNEDTENIVYPGAGSGDAR